MLVLGPPVFFCTVAVTLVGITAGLVRRMPRPRAMAITAVVWWIAFAVSLAAQHALALDESLPVRVLGACLTATAGTGLGLGALLLWWRPRA